MAVNSNNSPCVGAAGSHAETCYDASDLDYPSEVIVQALQGGKHSELAGMFEHSAGNSLELRSGEGDSWTDSVAACGGHSVYIRPRAARNSRGE